MHRAFLNTKYIQVAYVVVVHTWQVWLWRMQYGHSVGTAAYKMLSRIPDCLKSWCVLDQTDGARTHLGICTVFGYTLYLSSEWWHVTKTAVLDDIHLLGNSERSKRLLMGMKNTEDWTCSEMMDEGFGCEDVNITDAKWVILKDVTFWTINTYLVRKIVSQCSTKGMV